MQDDCLWVVLLGAQHCVGKCGVCGEWTEAGGPQLVLTSFQHRESILPEPVLICAVNRASQGENENDTTQSTIWGLALF